MRHALPALLVGAALALAGVAPAVAADRLDALAATLRERPLAVDPEFGWLLDARQERRILRALRGSPVPIYAAALPQVETDESGGDPTRIALALHRRLGQPGLYVLINERGELDTLAFDVPREGAVSFELTPFPPERERATAFTAVRVERLVDTVASLPAGTTDEADREPRPLEPYAPSFSRRYGEAPASFGGVAVGAGFIFGVLGLATGFWLRMVEGRRRRREGEAAKAETARLAREDARQQPRKGRRRGRRAPWKRMR